MRPLPHARTVRAAIIKATTEAEFQADVIELCRTLGLRVYHTHDSRRSPAGFPDLVIVGPGGVLFRELKTENGPVSAYQVDWLRDLTRAGADAAVWRPSDWPTRIRAELSVIRYAARSAVQ